MRLAREIAVLSAFAACAVALSAARADLVCATWNLKWFPSGRKDVRASAAEERVTLALTAETLSDAIRSIPACREDEVSPAGATDGIILFLQEMRDARCCTNLVRRVGIPGLEVAVASRFISGMRPVWQQVCIATTLPVIESGFEPWNRLEGVDIPRGFAYAVLDLGGGMRVACFSVHLKSNMNFSGTELEHQENIYKREVSAGQVLAKYRDIRRRHGEMRVIVAGDFNTDENEEFVSEATLRSFYGAHFRDAFTGLKPEDRVTRPASGGYGDTTFDHILYRGFGRLTGRYIVPGQPFSDHNLVIVELEPKPAGVW